MNHKEPKAKKPKSKKAQPFVLPTAVRPFVRQSLLNVLQYCRECLTAEGKPTNSVRELYGVFKKETGSPSLTEADFKRMLKSFGLRPKHLHSVEISEKELATLIDTPLPNVEVEMDELLVPRPPAKKAPRKTVREGMTVNSETAIPQDTTLDTDEDFDGFDPLPPPKKADADDVKPFSLNMTSPGSVTTG